MTKRRLGQYIQSPFSMHRSMLTASRLTEELNDGLHLSSREELRVGLVAHGRHGIPQAAREVHLLAEEAHGTTLF